MFGQSINLDKSMVYLSPNTPIPQHMTLSSLLKMNVINNLDGYLGLPIPIGKKKSAAFQNITDRAANRSNSWSKRLLFKGGKEIFIKSILQAIPTYAFSVFFVPNGVLDELQSMIYCVWDLRQFNVALLGRQVWRLVSYRDTLCFRVLSAKYFPERDMLHPKQVDKPLFTWQIIAKAASILYDGFGWNRLGHDILPTLEKILSIHLKVNSTCLRCGADKETLLHAMKKCSRERAVLVYGGLKNTLLKGCYDRCVDWFEDVARSLDRKTFPNFITVFWNIWNSKNNRVFQEVEEEAKVTWDKAAALSQDFRIFNLLEKPMLPKSAIERTWKKPGKGVVKINFDASTNGGKTSIGFVARDHDSFVLGGQAGVWDKNFQAEWAELYALGESMSYARAKN
ncbi:hypothetical protein CXB51_014335 [Gossypium anomalum]|uniref:RNase H type-1 domain-containing protein n=1 Tax=Gossypium anomalum TaxID=47600 RepID=A0A8J5Z3F3_9ROSI|nr:hypothetical protein CXB51_014335 [Gossypium anomalum]